MKKVIIFHHEFCVSGGAEHTLFEVMDYLTDAGYQYECWAPIVDKRKCFPQKIGNYNIKSFLPYISLIPREIYPILVAILAPLFLLRFSRASLFYGANQSGPLFAYIASLIHKKPYLVYMPYPLNILYPRDIDTKFRERNDLSFLGKIILSFAKPVLYFIDQKVIKSASAVLTEGRYAVELFQKIYKRDIINAPAGAATISETELNSIDKKPFILLTNRHTPKKKFEYAIESQKMINEYFLKQNKPTPQLVITGDKTEYTLKLKELIDRYHIQEKVTFTGLLSENEINNLYKYAAVYIYTAPEEDYGKGVIQALASGTPCVVWDNAGPGKNVVNNLTGYTIPLEDINSYTEKILAILENKQLRLLLSHNARAYAEKHFSKNTHKQIILSTIKKYDSQA